MLWLVFQGVLRLFPNLLLQNLFLQNLLFPVPSRWVQRWGGFRSALAADNLQKMGYRNVISMDGGWRGWTESGFPVIKD